MTRSTRYFFVFLFLFTINLPLAFAKDCEKVLGENDQTTVVTITEPETKSYKVRELPQNLTLFSRDLTREAFEGKLDSVVGREHEINQLIDVLNQRKVSSAILLGESGTGKTAIVEGLAQRIAKNDVPESIRGNTIIELNLTNIVSGTIYRGSFEERIKNIVAELKQNRDIIVFVDEIHSMMGAGSALGSPMDAANILKTEISNGHMKVIGATTLNEYREHVEKDQAFSRRLKPIRLRTLTREELLNIINTHRLASQKHYKINIPEEVAAEALELSSKYLRYEGQPSISISLLDSAASRIQREKVGQTPIVMTVEDVQKQIEIEKQIPVTQLNDQNRESLNNIEVALRSEVIGQETAVAAVARAIKRARAGLSDSRKPFGSFLFLGPTGVGKTELARALAKYLFGDVNALIRLDMSEYMDHYSSSKLLGAVPGLVGNDIPGTLTEPIRQRPFSVLLVDEFEKAHPSVWTLFLQILDNGEISDGKGRKVSFQNTIVIFTGNMGAREARKNELGFIPSSSVQEKQSKVVTQTLAPEFANRFDEIVYFNSLTPEVIGGVVDKQINATNAKLTAKNIRIELTQAAKYQIVSAGFSENYGARNLQRTFRRLIEEPLAELLVSGGLNNSKNSVKTIAIHFDGHKFVFTEQ